MRPEVAAKSRAFRLRLPRIGLSGRAGGRLGHAPGSSLEFLDFRDYVPGDDPRHVDWRTYARTDQLKVRVFHEEVSPVLEVIVDASASLAVTEAKEHALRDLVVAAGEWARRLPGTARFYAAGGGPIADPEALRLGGRGGSLVPAVPLRPRSLRLVVSDFLFEADPVPDLRRCLGGAAHLWAVQLLDRGEVEPEATGALTLVDCETDATLDLLADERAVRAYRTRLARLCDGVAHAVRAGGGTFARVVAAEPLAMFAELLVQDVIEAVA